MLENSSIFHMVKFHMVFKKNTVIAFISAWNYFLLCLQCEIFMGLCHCQGLYIYFAIRNEIDVWDVRR